MSQALTMEQILDNEGRREATQLSVKEIYELQAEVERLRAAGWVDLTAAVGYQRRHRNWALKEAREWYDTATDDQKVKGEYMRAFDKADAEVVKLKRIVRIAENNQMTAEMEVALAEVDLSRQRRLRKRSIDFARFSYLKRCMAEEEVEGLILQGVQTEARAEKAEADKAKLVEALEYYADPHNYREDDWGVVAVIAEYGEAGKKARAVLKEVKL